MQTPLDCYAAAKRRASHLNPGESVSAGSYRGAIEGWLLDSSHAGDAWVPAIYLSNPASARPAVLALKCDDNSLANMLCMLSAANANNHCRKLHKAPAAVLQVAHAELSVLAEVLLEMRAIVEEGLCLQDHVRSTVDL